MTAPAYLLDTNVLTGILKQDARVVDRVTAALTADARLVLSPIVYYEIQRGLLRRDARKQLDFFEQLAQSLHWDDLQRTDWNTAAQLWAGEVAHGRPPQDADILLAAQSHRLKSHSGHCQRRSLRASGHSPRKLVGLAAAELVMHTTKVRLSFVESRTSLQSPISNL